MRLESEEHHCVAHGWWRSAETNVRLHSDIEQREESRNRNRVLLWYLAVHCGQQVDQVRGRNLDTPIIDQ
jgi:hypothetical protein